MERGLGGAQKYSLWIRRPHYNFGSVLEEESEENG
jgi:hypothetical protein